MKVIKTYSVEETIDFGFKIGGLLSAGDIISLNGDLGTGKTAFTSGIAEALGINCYITSPTFTIVNEYKGNIPLYHFDAYRIGSYEEMFDIGFEEYVENNGIIVIEWADLIKEVLPPEHIRIDINKDLAKDVDLRIIEVDFIGDKYNGFEEKLSQCFR
jgi:tRNA threonylcarbamoyladenosine biosynthesis protein TsaE